MSAGKIIPRICLTCGVAFGGVASAVKRGGALYCSEACYRNRDWRASVAKRFWSKVDKTPGQGPKGECWIWIGSLINGGRGSFGRGGRNEGTVLAHRFAWELEHGPIPDGLFVLHRCDNPPCVRCLFLGTAADNSDDMAKKGRSHRKLQPDQVLEIRNRIILGQVPESIASDFGVSRSAIRGIKDGQTWRHVHIECGRGE